jgi:peptide/nickel transport system permease protein
MIFPLLGSPRTNLICAREGATVKGRVPALRSAALTTAPTAIDAVPGRGRRMLRPSGSFVRFLLRRLAALVLLGVGITVVVFILTQLVPSNATATNLGEQAAGDPAAVAAFKHHYGLDRPLPLRYAIYLEHLAQGDLGQSSLTHDAVTRDLGQFIPATAELALYSIVFAAVCGIGFGVLAAMRRNRPVDHALRVVSLAGISMPTFWIALVALYVGFFRLGWFPGAERLDPGTNPPPHVTGLYSIDALFVGDWGLFVQALHHLVLPALVLAAFNVSLLTRYTRSAVLEVVGNDYVRAARAKGLPERVVVFRHILRAALPSVVTVLGLVFANVLTGAVLVEKIFSWPGIGQYAYQAAVNLDVPAIAGVSLFVAVVYITVNFVVDVLYGVIDPRIRVT